MDRRSPQEKYQTLGRQLKVLRTRANESLAEASGAVEIDARELAGFELGKSRPTEDVLLLLISHFGARDDEAMKLWQIAGYAGDKPVVQILNDNPLALPGGIEVEQRVLFTDIIDIMVNNYGVVLNFMQTSGPNRPPANVARVGMSREHAKTLLQILQATLHQTEPRQLDKKPDAPKTN